LPRRTGFAGLFEFISNNNQVAQIHNFGSLQLPRVSMSASQSCLIRDCEALIMTRGNQSLFVGSGPGENQSCLEVRETFFLLESSSWCSLVIRCCSPGRHGARSGSTRLEGALGFCARPTAGPWGVLQLLWTGFAGLIPAVGGGAGPRIRGFQPPLLALPRRKATHCAGQVSAALRTS
jgi:hypothetical protein